MLSRWKNSRQNSNKPSAANNALTDQYRALAHCGDWPDVFLATVNTTFRKPKKQNAPQAAKPCNARR
jgi:hypothetical protein